MADLILSPIVDLLVEKLAAYLKDQHELRSDVDGKLKKLEEALNQIQAVVKIANEVELEKNEPLAKWLRVLKDAADEAEDVLDEFEYPALEREVATAAADQDDGGGRDNDKHLTSQSGISSGQEVSIRIETAESTATLEDPEIVKHARKVAYWTSTLSVGGIISIGIGLAGGQVTLAYSRHLKICLLFLVASFISAAFLILLLAPPRSPTDRTKIVRALECTTVGGLVVAILDVSFIFLKLFALIIGVPFLFFLLLAFLLRCCSTIS